MFKWWNPATWPIFRKRKSTKKPTRKPVENKPIPEPINNYQLKYAELWKTCEVDPNRIKSLKRVCLQIAKNTERYALVERYIGCPKWIIGAYHYRESSLNFAGVLHNGQRIIGTGKKTTWVPKGRGPFKTWEDSAIDALKIKKYNRYKNWDAGTCFERAERFNGLGYRKRIGDSGHVELSPYVFAGTNHHDETSKYVSDGKYDKHAPEKQFGVMAIAKGLEMFHGWKI